MVIIGPHLMRYGSATPIVTFSAAKHRPASVRANPNVAVDYNAPATLPPHIIGDLPDRLPSNQERPHAG